MPVETQNPYDQIFTPDEFLKWVYEALIFMEQSYPGNPAISALESWESRVEDLIDTDPMMKMSTLIGFSKNQETGMMVLRFMANLSTTDE